MGNQHPVYAFRKIIVNISMMYRAFTNMLRLGSAWQPSLLSDTLQIRNPGMYPFYVVTDIQYNTGEYVENKRKTYR
jgi:hypothetical protein